MKDENLISALKKGNYPEHLKTISEKESISLEKIAEGILSGGIVVPKNRLRQVKKPCAIGKNLSVKVNANIGSSKTYPEPELEIEKMKSAEEAGADTLMDLSTGDGIGTIRRNILEKSILPLGTVPIYEAAIRAIEDRGSIVEMEENDLLETIENQASGGVDFMTIHSGITLESVTILKKQPRVMGVVSRGGSFIFAWMIHNQKENPLYERFDDVLSILKKYDVTLSLGDGLRPGCISDSTDAVQISELIKLGELVKRARSAEVQVMVEGPGHIPLSEIEANVRLEKAICRDAPFYVLGPLPTDIAPGYDHIVSAIGGSLAAYYGADFLCYVTPREHLGLPNANDVREGVIASKIAAHIADIARSKKQAVSKDRKMAEARNRLDWEKQIELSICPEKTRQMFEERSSYGGPCTMCGEYCAIDILKESLNTGLSKNC